VTSRRHRLTLALAAGIALAVALVVVLLATSGPSTGDDTAAAPPQECLDRWNENPDALSYARHNRVFHLYDEAQVGYLAMTDGPVAVSTDPTGGECVVVFPRDDLDPEIVAVGQVYREGGWLPLSEVVALEDLGGLQRDAFEGANAQPLETGQLEPL
jgi:hypothetical protein